MIVIAADQVASPPTPAVASATLERLNREFGERLVLPADHTESDAIEILVADGRAAVDVALDLTRTGRWRVGVGFGREGEPLGAGIRESAGDAFVAARSAVDRAKKRQTRFAAAARPAHEESGDLEALVDLLLVLRARRSEQGWEVHDLVARGLTQAEAADEIGITPQSASKRARAAELKTENAAIAPLARLADALDAALARVETP